MELNHEHIEEEILESYSRGVLSGDSASHVELHLLICQTCRERLAASDDYLKAMEAAARGLRSRQRAGQWWRWSSPRLIPIFAALAAIIVIAVVAWPVRHDAPTPFAVSLVAMRGPSHQAGAPSRRPLLLELDLTGLAASPTYRVEMVNQLGERVWQGVCKSSGATASVAVPPQKPGEYFVRVALPSGDALREYGLALRGID